MFLVRPWNLPDLPDFNLPDNKRFNAMNYEIPTIMTAAQNPDSRYHKHSEVQKWLYRLGELRTLHDLVIAPGMARRGINHNSPLKNVDGIQYQPFNPTPEEFLTDLLEIRLRQVVDVIKPAKSPRSAIATAMIKEASD